MWPCSSARFESNYRPKTSSVERKLEELAGTVVSLDATVHEFAMDMLAFEALLVKIASQLGVDVEADTKSLSAKLALQQYRSSLHDVSRLKNTERNAWPASLESERGCCKRHLAHLAWVISDSGRGEARWS